MLEGSKSSRFGRFWECTRVMVENSPNVQNLEPGNQFQSFLVDSCGHFQKTLQLWASSEVGWTAKEAHLYKSQPPAKNNRNLIARCLKSEPCAQYSSISEHHLNQIYIVYVCNVCCCLLLLGVVCFCFRFRFCFWFCFCWLLLVVFVFVFVFVFDFVGCCWLLLVVVGCC